MTLREEKAGLVASLSEEVGRAGVSSIGALIRLKGGEESARQMHGLQDLVQSKTLSCNMQMNSPIALPACSKTSLH